MSTKKEEKKLNGKEEEENIKWFHELRILYARKRTRIEQSGYCGLGPPDTQMRSSLWCQ